MNIKQFLLDNYIWILVVILLLIITIIGFLVDKKKEKTKKSQQVEQPMPVNNQMAQMPINYQSNQNMNQEMMTNNFSQNSGVVGNNFNPNQNIPVNLGTIPNSVVMPTNMGLGNDTINNTIPTPIYNQAEQQNVSVNGMVTMGNSNDAVLPVIDNVNSQVLSNFNNVNVEPMNVQSNVEVESMNGSNQDSLYQPLSEQKPTFAPREVNIPDGSISSFNNPNFVSNNNIGVDNSNLNNSITLNNSVNNFSQPQQATNNFGNAPLQPQMTMPSPVPVVEQNNVLNSAPVSMPVTDQNNALNSIPMQQPVNFVYGPQQPNNNQFM